MTSSDIRIREAKPDDFANVAEMHYPVWRQSWTGILAPPLLDILGPPKRWVAEIYPQTLSRRGWSMWIAESGGQTLGVTIFGPDTAAPDDLQIDALYIANGHHRSAAALRVADFIAHYRNCVQMPVVSSRKTHHLNRCERACGAKPVLEATGCTI